MRPASHGVSGPCSVFEHDESALLRSTGTPSPCGLSQTLEGLILTEPCGLISFHIRSWGSFDSPGLFPSAEHRQARHLPDTFSAFAHHLLSKNPEVSSSASGAAPPRRCVLRWSVTRSEVLHPLRARCPPELRFRLCGIRSDLERVAPRAFRSSSTGLPPPRPPGPARSLVFIRS